MTDKQSPNHFPIVMEMKIYITNGEEHGIATFRCPCFTTVSNEYISEYLVKTSKQLPPGYRLMTRDEVYNFLLTEEHGMAGILAPSPEEGELWFSELSSDEGGVVQ